MILNWWTKDSPVKNKDGIIADGSIRSGKTIAMSLSFVLWGMNTFSNQNLGMAGKTIGSFRRNVLFWLKMMLFGRGYIVEEHRTDGYMDVIHRQTGNVNHFYIFGGKDESSQDLIQGITLAGMFFDEVALMPESFVNQATGRCSVEGSKYWFNCNPDNPNHYFKKNWIEKRNEKNLIYLHFMMDDNLSLSEEIKRRYRKMYTGVFYQRFILGLWVAAEGKIYMAFTQDNILKKNEFLARNEEGLYIHPLRRNIVFCTVGVDFGGNKSSTAFNLTGYTKGFQELITLKERRIKDELTPKQLEREFLLFMQECIAEYPNEIREVRADSAEQILIRGLRTILRKNKIPIPIKNAVKGEIIDRIRFYTSMMSLLRYFILDDCVETIDAFETAVWDDDHENERLDDGSVNIDSLDAQEYSSEPFMKSMIDMRR